MLTAKGFTDTHVLYCKYIPVCVEGPGFAHRRASGGDQTRERGESAPLSGCSSRTSVAAGPSAQTTAATEIIRDSKISPHDTLFVKEMPDFALLATLNSSENSKCVLTNSQIPTLIKLFMWTPSSGWMWEQNIATSQQSSLSSYTSNQCIPFLDTWGASNLQSQLSLCQRSGDRGCFFTSPYT